MSSLVLHLGIKRVDKAVRGALTAQGQLRVEARATTEVGGNHQVGGVAGDGGSNEPAVLQNAGSIAPKRAHEILIVSMGRIQVSSLR